MKIIIDGRIELSDDYDQLNIRLHESPIDSTNFIRFTGDESKVLKVMIDRVMEKEER